MDTPSCLHTGTAGTPTGQGCCHLRTAPQPGSILSQAEKGHRKPLCHLQGSGAGRCLGAHTRSTHSHTPTISPSLLTLHPKHLLCSCSAQGSTSVYPPSRTDAVPLQHPISTPRCTHSIHTHSSNTAPSDPPRAAPSCSPMMESSAGAAGWGRAQSSLHPPQGSMHPGLAQKAQAEPGQP